MTTRTRREFLEQSLLAAAAATLAGSETTKAAEDAPKRPASPNDRLKVACIGVGGRGSEHIREFVRMHDCDLVAVVDVDETIGKRRVDTIKSFTGKEPKYYRDLRKMLEDKSIDVVSIATPNHWHSLAAIWAVQAGKDVYVEKPVSHNVSEGRRLVQAARKHHRIVQAGTQCRSNPGMRDLMKFVHSGKIGEVKLARGTCYKHRGSIGPKGTYKAPATVDYDLWLGPAPVKPPARQKFHYDWHWFWDYGNGDLGNQGIHQMDLCRWGLDVHDIGLSVMSYGGRLGYEDAGETANTQVSVHEYPNDKRLVFEVRGLKTPPCPGTQTRGEKGGGVAIVLYGTEGFAAVPSYSGGVVYDKKRNQIAKFNKGGDAYHFKNFIQAVRSRNHLELNGDVLEGHLSSALCHLANISYRLGQPASGEEVAERLTSDDENWETFERFRDHLWYNDVPIRDAKVVGFGRSLKIDPKGETFIAESATEDAKVLLTRAYRAPFVVPSEKDV